MSGSGKTFEDIIKNTIDLLYSIKDETLFYFFRDHSYENIFSYNKDFRKTLEEFKNNAENSRGKINAFIDGQNHNLEYDDSKCSQDEKRINEIKINYIRELLDMLDRKCSSIIDLNNKIMGYIDDSNSDYANVSYDDQDADLKKFVKNYDDYIAFSFMIFTIIYSITDKFKDKIPNNTIITKDDLTDFNKFLDELTSVIYDQQNAENTYYNIHKYLEKKITEFQTTIPLGLNVKNNLFPIIGDILKNIYDDKIEFNITEVVKCIDILLPKNSVRLYPLLIEAFNKKSGSNILQVEDEYKIVFGLDIGKFGPDTDKSGHKKPIIGSDIDYNRVIEKLENEIKEINNDMLRLKHRSNKQGYYTRLHKISDYRTFKTQTDREPQDFIAQIKLKNIGGKQNIGKYKYITEDSLGKAANNNRARELANNYNQLTDKMIETEKKIGGIQKLALNDLNKSESGYVRMRGGEQQTLNYNNLIKQYQLMAIKQNNIINEIKNIKNGNY